MDDLKNKLAWVDWQSVLESMNEKGYSISPKIVSKENCMEIIRLYNSEDLYRKTVTMERYRFGLREYKYFNYP